MDSINGPSSLSLGRRLRVMIVDDNAINLSILSRILDHHFSDIATLAVSMTSGVSALEHLAQHEVDLILMDIDMPVLTGVQTTEAIRQHADKHSILHANRLVPIIAVTTSDGPDQQALYRQSGMVACVSKPIDKQHLRDAIEDALKSSPSQI
ncbi:sensitivity to red-light reduced protein [Podila epigama]|nr:sensitivity to red-light reduced protein [Podila epigama]